MERSKENLEIKSQEDFMNEINPNSHVIKLPNVKRGIIERIWANLRGFVVIYRMRRYSRYRVKVIKESIRRSREDIQIMEYHGMMYISYKGIPIVRLSEVDLGCPWEYVLKSSRIAYQSWLSERELEKMNIENE